MLGLRKFGFLCVYAAIAVLGSCYGLTFATHIVVNQLAWQSGYTLAIIGLVMIGLYFLGRMFGVSRPYNGQ